MEKKIILMVLSFFTLLSGCAFDLVLVKQIPTQMDLMNPPEISWKLVEDVPLKLGTGYRRKLKNGTKWDYVGKIKYGNVFKTDDQILTVEGSNIFEAYIVVAEGKIVGFYLPVKKAYSPLSSPKEFNMELTGSK